MDLGGESCIFGKGLLLTIEHLLRLAGIRLIDLAHREAGVDENPVPHPGSVIALEHLQAHLARHAADPHAGDLLHRIEDLEYLAWDR
jgi:hypothetical protein